MKKILLLLFISSFAFGQDYQQLCVACAEANGFYCGDDPSNWTQYAPDGCVQTDWIGDGWEDCVDASDEVEGALPTPIEACVPPPPPSCDTVYIYETVIEYETIIETQYIYLTDTVYADVLDTMFIDVIEYVDCVSGLPCQSGMQEVLDKSKNTGLLYNLNGQHIRKPEGIYIENGKIKYRL